MGDATVPHTPSGHKGAGCGPPLWKPYLGDGRASAPAFGIQPPGNTHPVVRSEAERTGLVLEPFRLAAQ